MSLKRQLVGFAILSLAAGMAACTAQAAAGETTIGGKMYGDLTYKQVENAAGKKTAGTGVGFDESRFYLSASHTIDDVWSLNFTSDIGDQNGAYDMYVKKAFVQAKLPNSAVMVRAGVTDMPWIPFVESLYGFRYVEKTLIDRTGFGTSADWGVHVLGSAAEKKVNYQASIINGGGYKKPARSKNVDFAGRLGVTPVPGLDVAVAGYFGTLGRVAYGQARPYQNASRIDAVIGWHDSMCRLGGEFFQANKWGSLVTSATDDKAQGFAAWASYTFMDGWTAFARGDYEKPSKDLDSDYKDKYANIGIQYAAGKGVVISPVVKWEKMDGSVAPAGSPSGTPVQHAGGKVVEFGLFGQAAF